MYRKILSAVDGSEVSERALDEALKLATYNHAAVCLAHAVDTTVPAVGDAYVNLDEYRESFLELGRDVIKHAADRARTAGIEPETALLEVDTNQLSAAIIGEAIRWGADLIVLGTHGRSGLSRFLVGSVAEGVVRHTPVPVLLVRGP